jgi:hypothetical protein
LANVVSERHILGKLLCFSDLLFYALIVFMYLVLISLMQAENPDWNSIGIFKISNVSGKRRELVPTKATAGDSDMDADNSDNDSDSDEDSEDEEEGGSAAPVLQVTSCTSVFVICLVKSWSLSLFFYPFSGCIFIFGFFFHSCARLLIVDVLIVFVQ